MRANFGQESIENLSPAICIVSFTFKDSSRLAFQAQPDRLPGAIIFDSLPKLSSTATWS